MWRVLTFFVGIYVMVVLPRVDSSIEVVCRPNDNITVIINKTLNPNVVDGFIAFPGVDNCRSDFVESGNGTQTASATCFNFTIGQSFFLYLLKNITVDQEDDMQTYNVTCEPGNTTRSVVSRFIDVQPLSFNPRVFGLPLAGVPVFAVGDPVFFGVTVGNSLIATRTIQLEYLRIDTSSGSVFLVQDGCPQNTPVSVTLTGNPANQPAHTVTAQFPAYADFADATAGVISALVFYGYSICDINQVPSACFTAGGCPSGGDKIGKRRRRDSNSLGAKEDSFRIYIFRTKAEKEAFYDKIIQQELAERAAKAMQNKDDLCVSTTVTAVSISLLGCAFLLCLLSTIAIGTKLYKTGKRGHVKFENSNSSVTSYVSKDSKQ